MDLAVPSLTSDVGRVVMLGGGRHGGIGWGLKKLIDPL